MNMRESQLGSRSLQYRSPDRYAVAVIVLLACVTVCRRVTVFL